MTYVGKAFPNLAVSAIGTDGKVTKINVRQHAIEEKKKVLLFWYPKNFTGVCNSEMQAFEDARADFAERNTVVIGASCDTVDAHMAWLGMEPAQGGIKGIGYPILADTNRNLSSVLGILDIKGIHYDDELGLDVIEGENIAYRATYLIDEQGQVFHESINHLPLGRNTADYLRMVDAFTHIQENGVGCPANWTKS